MEWISSLQVILALVYVVSPFLLLRIRGRWGVPAAILALWIPIEAGLFRWAGIPPAVTMALAVVTGLAALRSRHDVLNTAAAFDLRKFEMRRAFVNFLLFAAIAIPLGYAVGFIRFVFDASELRTVPMLFATVFLFNALPEEVLFRSLIQNWLERRLGWRMISLIFASLIFGASHLNNGPPVPNYKYFVLASIAGVFYGRAWGAHRNALTSSLTHTLVNTSWSLFFR